MSCARFFQVVQFPCLSDNYGYLIHSPTTGETAAIDTPDAATYERELSKQGWKLTHILNTHHHWDHAGGNEELKNTGVQIIGPVKEKNKIPGIDVAVGGGDVFSLGGTEVQVLDVGGHTRGHVAFYFPNDKIVFVGDALFVLGCGKMFEGTPQQFWSSLKRLRELPDDTVVYCAHEYTEGNAKFAMSVEPGNEVLVKRVAELMRLRKRGDPTVPSILGDEKVTNPFLRVDVSEEIRKNVGASDDEPHDEVFAKVRRAKDTFRG
jgi:hydroxyacylglutathione hydrolase